MKTSFAQIPRLLNVGVLVLALNGCASVPPPTSELSAAQQALNRASGADADQYAQTELMQARNGLSRAQSLVSAGEQEDARAAALAATADADLATAISRARATQQEYSQRRDEIAGLRQRLQVDDGNTAPALADIGAVSLPTPGSEALRLQRLDSDERLHDYAAYERLQARQALNTQLAAKKRDQPAAAYLAARRIAIAEIAAQTEQMRREVGRMERDRSDLMVEASRQEAEHARQEIERMRVQAQIQAEEAQRARDAAMAADAARQQAEDTIISVGGAEAKRLKAARDREAELARQEAELLAQDPSQPAPPKQEAKPKAKPKSGTKK